MSKATKKNVKPAVKAVAKKAVEAQPAQTIAVAKKDEKYEGARAAWYAALLAHPALVGG